MSNSDTPQRIHVVVGQDMTNAVRYLSDPDPDDYFPWWTGRESANPHELVALIVDTEPRSIVTTLGWVGANRDLGHPEVDALPLELMPIAALEGPDYGFDGREPKIRLLEGELAASLVDELNRNRRRWEDRSRWGHHTMAAAAIVLSANGRCAGCGTDGWTRNLYARTVELDGGDYPAALCHSCLRSVEQNGFDTFLDLKLAQNPECPSCSAHRTQSIAYGMPVFDRMVPWYRYAGCCVSVEQWSCLECDHSW